MESGIITEPGEARSIFACSFLTNKHKDLGLLVQDVSIPLWEEIIINDGTKYATQKLGVIFELIHLERKGCTSGVGLMDDITNILTPRDASHLYNVVANIIKKSQGDTANELDPERADAETISAGRNISADDLKNILQGRVQGEQGGDEGLQALLRGDSGKFIDVVLKAKFSEDNVIKNVKLALQLLHPSSDPQEREMYTALC